METSFLVVGKPAEYEGVGQALRRAFQAERSSIPADLTDLLDHLDRH